MRNISENKKYHFIYKTTNLINGCYFFGMHSTNNLDDGYLGSGTRLRYSIRKYGKENFRLEILEYSDTREELIKRETEIITLEEIAKKECMNLKPGGQGGFKNEEHKKAFHAAGGRAVLRLLSKRHIEKLKTDKQYFDRFCLSLKGRQTFKDKQHSAETKNLISVSAKITSKGEKNSQYGTCWITNGIENKKIKKEDLPNWLNNNWKQGREVTFLNKIEK